MRTAFCHSTDVGARLGRDLEAEIVLLAGGSVVARLDGREWLINTSLERYRASLIAVGTARDSGALDDARVAELERRLREIDQEALAAPGSYWAAVLEQIWHEQL